MIGDSIMKYQAHLKMGQARWLIINFFPLKILTPKEYIKSPEKSKLRKGCFMRNTPFGERELGCACPSHTREEGACFLTASLLGGAFFRAIEHSHKTESGPEQAHAWGLIIKATLCGLPLAFWPCSFPSTGWKLGKSFMTFPLIN